METLSILVSWLSFAAAMFVPLSIIGVMIAWVAFGIYTEATLSEAARKAREQEYREREERYEALVDALIVVPLARKVRHQALKAERHVRHLERDPSNRVA